MQDGFLYRNLIWAIFLRNDLLQNLHTVKQALGYVGKTVAVHFPLPYSEGRHRTERLRKNDFFHFEMKKESAHGKLLSNQFKLNPPHRRETQFCFP